MTSNRERRREKGETNSSPLAPRSSILASCAGATIIEVLLATVLVVSVVMGLAVLAPKLTKAIIQRSARSTANSIAASTLATITPAPYPAIALTPTSYFPLSSLCDCKQVDWAAIPSTAVTSGQSTYTEKVCVNLVTAPGVAVCPSPTISDTGDR